MVRRIKLVSRVLNSETEVRAPADEDQARRRRLPLPGEVTVPPADVYETGEEIVVELELPGVSEKDVQVQLFAGRIEVTGLKRELSAHEGSRFLRLEREFGAFRREVAVPAAFDAGRARAILANGVLTVTLRKPPRRTRDVNIKSRRPGE
ncbi:MAG: Hsp20/alpha crystallin family protein [Candidatus Aminicenantes bacterium]|nr:Hsp20/alpha crystallin family protein [Candidatus Aminicenantes bacterium]